MATFQLNQQLASMVQEVLCTLIDLLRLGMVIGVCGDVAHLPETEPGFDIGNQALFSRNAKQIPKAGLIDRRASSQAVRPQSNRQGIDG